MGRVFSKLIGMDKSKFDELVHNGDIHVRRAMLVPVLKVGDEMALTSILLSSMRLIREFRRSIKSDIKMAKGGELFTYTEVGFPDTEGMRFDGLVLVVKSGKIKDAAVIELKNGSNRLSKKQIESYISICKTYDISRLVTVSNEYVSEPSQFPIDVKPHKSLSLYHLSWSYLLTVAHLLLFDNDMNIEDEDQVSIMKEVVSHFEHEKSGICGFSKMKSGWTDTVKNINNGTFIKAEDQCVKEAVLSWQQEERDIALKLSRQLGVLVKSGYSKYKSDYSKRIQDDTKELVDKKHLHSNFGVDGAVSDIEVTALLEKRAIEASVKVKIPKDKTVRGQVGWIKKQLDTCFKRASDDFKKISENIYVEFYIKNSSKTFRMPYQKVDSLLDELKGRELKSVRVIVLKDFGKDFASRSKFIDIIEGMIFVFYKGVVQHLKNWEPSAPKIKSKPEKEESFSENKYEEDQWKDTEASIIQDYDQFKRVS